MNEAEAALMVWQTGLAPLATLYPVQRDMHALIERARAAVDDAVICCSRRLGKSTALVHIADYVARTKPDAQIRYACPTAKMARNIIRPIFRRLWKRCPEHLQPRYSQDVGGYVYPNGSVILVDGVDNGHEENLVGTSCDLFICDEAAKMKNLEEVVESVARPQTLTCDGVIVMASTPPKTPAHPFRMYCIQAEAAGMYMHKTIYDATHITPDRIEKYRLKALKRGVTYWLREYMAEFVVDENSAIIPEFNDAEKEIVHEIPRPDYCYKYVAADLGYDDLTAVLFGYWHFDIAKLVVEDEVILLRPRSSIIAEESKAKELELWGTDGTVGGKPARIPHAPKWITRVSDNDKIVLADMSIDHDEHFVPTLKDNKDAQVNAVRMMVHEREIIIHPRCKTLITHLRHGIWDTTRRKFARSGGAFGHFDAIDALVYMVRSLQKGRNPYPAIDPGASVSTHLMPTQIQTNAVAAQFGKILRRQR